VQDLANSMAMPKFLAAPRSAVVVDAAGAIAIAQELAAPTPL
jgi:hypothetical protein